MDAMHNLTLRALPLALILALPSLAHAGTIEANSHVTEATIFTDRALVTRTTKAHVPAGAQTIQISDLPAGINESTLRIQGKASAAVKLGTVEVKHVFLREAANAAEREKTAQIEAKNAEKALLQAEITALQAKQTFIARLVEAGAIKQDPNNQSKLDFSPEKWQQASTFIQTGMAETGKELASKNIAMAKIDADIARLQLDLAQIRTQQNKERRDARVNIEASSETDLDLTLTYQTSGAYWRPVYDARLDTSANQLDLEQYGSVTQTTGEDWSNVSLTLSTAQPASGSEMPSLREWWVRLFQPYARSKSAGTGSSFSVSSAPQALVANEMKDSVGMAAPVPEAAPVQAEQLEAAAATTEYSAEFKVPGRVDLKSTRDRTKLYLAAVKMKADLFAQTTPRLGAQAYLFAKAKNNEAFPLIPGEVAKYRDGSFIGNARLPMVRPDEETNFSFGIDDRIKVDYRQLKEKQENRTLIVVGDMTIERLNQTKIQNLHTTPITITVLEQYPVSSDSDVKVTLLTDQTTPGFTDPEEKRQGVIAWTAPYNPKEEKTFTLSFRVKYPKDRQLQGL